MKISPELFSAKTCGLVIPLLFSSGEEQELELISPGFRGKVGIDPTMAWDVPYLSVHRLLQETWAPPYVCMGDRGPKLLETEQITGCEGHELDTLFSH